MTSKTYTSKGGLKFKISEVPHPFVIENGEPIIFITGAEFDHLKSQNLTTEEFKTVWECRRMIYDSRILPESKELDCQKWARTIGQEIIDDLKTKKHEG